jgi:hypothetical protein
VRATLAGSRPASAVNWRSRAIPARYRGSVSSRCLLLLPIGYQASPNRAARRSKSHHHAAQHDQQQAGDVSDDLTAGRQGSRGEGRSRDPEEQIELLDQKANAMMAIAVRTQARNVRSFAAWSLYRSIIGRRGKGCHSERRAEEQSEFRHKRSKRNRHRNPDLAVKCCESTASGPTEAAEMLAFRKCRRSDNSEEQSAITASKQRK